MEVSNSASNAVLLGFLLEVSMDASSYVLGVAYLVVSNKFPLHGPSAYNNYTRDSLCFSLALSWWCWG